MYDSETKVKILQKTEDLVHQCSKLDDSKNIKQVAALFKLINNTTREKALNFYTEKIQSYIESIKQHLLKKECVFLNGTFCLENPLEINFNKIFEKANDQEKEILLSHFEGIAQLLWPEEFQPAPSKEKKLIDDIFNSLASLQHIEEKTPSHILQNIGKNTVLVDQTKSFISAVTSGSADPHVLLDHILKKIEDNEEARENESVEELKSIVVQAREKGKSLDVFQAIQIIRQLIATKSFKYFMENRQEILENIPEEAKNLVKFNPEIEQLIKNANQDDVANTLSTLFIQNTTECTEKEEN
jgi:hypothetical protein